MSPHYELFSSNPPQRTAFTYDAKEKNAMTFGTTETLCFAVPTNRQKPLLQSFAIFLVLTSQSFTW
jgi:hypothetical protein